MTDFFGPANARDRLSARLRELRESRGLSVAAVAEGLVWPTPVVAEIESGTAEPSLLEIEQLLGFYEVDSAESEHLLLLSRFARSRSSWAARGLTDEYHDAVAYEAEAVRISVYQPLIVPGLLQTPRYAAAATAAILRLDDDDPDVVARVRIRVERQRAVAGRVAAGESVEIVAVLDEAVLRRPVGGADVLREQLDHLADLAGQAHITLVVMPTALGAHAGLGGVFELLEFGGAPELSIVFIESRASDHIVRTPRATALHRQIVTDLVAAGRVGDDAVAVVRQIRDETGIGG